MTAHCNRMFTNEEEQQIAAIYEIDRFSTAKIAKAYGCSQQPIINAVRRQGGEIRCIRRRFTPEEEQQIAAIYDIGRFSSTEIAKAYGCNVSTICGAIKRNGVEIRSKAEGRRIAHSRRPEHFTDEEREQIMHIYKSGATVQEIADTYRCGKSRIDRSLDYTGTPRRRVGTRDGGHVQANRLFTEEEGKAIAQMYDSGHTADEVARVHGCCRETVLRRAKEHGVEIRPNHIRPITFSTEEKSLILQLYNEGFSLRSIGNRLSRGRGTIGKFLREQGVKLQPPIANQDGSGALLGKEHYGWKGGVSFELYSPEFNSALKQRIKERDCYTCQLCGVEKDLSVHHVDYDKLNNGEDNLITLCRSCNSRVNFDRGRYAWLLSSMQETGYDIMGQEYDRSAPEAIDICVISYNRGRFTEMCLEEIAKRTRFPYRLIVIDNGSTDGSTELLLETFNKGQIDLLLLLHSNTGIHFAWNVALGVSRSKPCFVTLDNDIIPQPGWLTLLVDLMDRHPDYGAICLRAQAFIGQGGNIFKDAGEILPRSHIPAYCRIMRTDVTREMGGWRNTKKPGRNNEDWTVGKRMKGEGYKVGFSKLVRCLHLWGDEDSFWGYPPGEEVGHRKIWPPVWHSNFDRKGFSFATCGPLAEEEQTMRYLKESGFIQ